VHVQVAGSEVLPARSVAVAANVWSPSASPDRRSGVEQLAEGAPSSEHWKVPGSLLTIANEAEAEFDRRRGSSVRVICGGTRSCVHCQVAGAAKFLARSAAIAANVCRPSASFL